MEEIEQAWKSFESAVGQTWKNAQDQREAGVDVQTQYLAFRYPVHDPEIQEATDTYFSILAAITGLLKHFPALGSSVDGALVHSREFVNALGLAPAERRALEGRLGQLESGKSTLIMGILQGHVNTLQGLKKHLETVNRCRIRATKLQYKVEQWELASQRALTKKFADLAKSQEWKEEAKRKLEFAKPEFIKTMGEYAECFHGVRKGILEAFHKERRTFVGVVIGDGQLSRPSVGVDWDDVDAVLEGVRARAA
jgi:hypothetical protein